MGYVYRKRHRMNWAFAILLVIMTSWAAYYRGAKAAARVIMTKLQNAGCIIPPDRKDP